ncbi:MAG: prolyl oligopeptidase family serine peptidase [Emcibacteraceae bacterium]|nr:prolyl oligopeptidase family serine peptidase [Emcibacteraceae bacterium]
MKYAALFLTTILFSILPANAQLSIEKAVEAFGVNPEISSVKVSPDGDKLLMLQMYQGKKVLITKSLTNPEIRPYGIPLIDGEYVWADWANNDRIIVGVKHDKYEKYSKVMSLHDSLMSLDWTGKDQINLAFERSRNSWFDLGQGHVLNWLIKEPNHILVTIVGDIYKLNILTNDYEIFHKTNLTERAFHINDNGVLRYIAARQKSGGFNHKDLYRKSDESEWREVFNKQDHLKENPFKFEGLTENLDVVFVSKYDEEGNYSLYRYNVDNRQIIEKIELDQNLPVLGYKISQEGVFESYKYFDGKENMVYLSNIEKRVSNTIKLNFPDTITRIESASLDKNKFVIFVSSPTEPGTYYLLDLSSNKLEMLNYNYQQVDINNLASTKIIEFKSRDDVRIQGFVTLPKNITEGEKLPTIILPHDGPNDRSSWNFDPLVQFLVSQGYATLEINYRGSKGYGKIFKDLALEEWGNKVIEDVNDGAKWMIEQKYADPDRICIFGYNYGGYAALQAVILDNSLYKCLAALSPITDVFMKSTRLSRNGSWNGRVPDYSYTNDEFENFRKKDEWSFRDISPIENIDQINVPILHLNNIENTTHANDQFYKFRRKMKSANKDYSFVDYKPRDEKNDISPLMPKVLLDLGKFFEKHLK